MNGHAQRWMQACMLLRAALPRGACMGAAVMPALSVCAWGLPCPEDGSVRAESCMQAAGAEAGAGTLLGKHVPAGLLGHSH